MGYLCKNIKTEDVVNLYNGGMNKKQISRKFNCDPSAIHYHLKKAGVKIRNPFEKFTKIKIDKIISLYKSGKTMTDVAKYLGYSYTSVWKYLKKNGLYGRGASFYLKGKRQLKRILGEKIESGYRLIYKPNHWDADKTGYVKEHRFVVSNHLKRRLNKNEVVHHINGDGLDNRIENLVAITRANHARIHRLNR